MKMLALACAMMTFCAVCLAQETGPVTIGGVTFEKVDPGEPFRERPAPPQDWQPPAPTAAERAAGMIAFVTADAGHYKPDRIPRPEEHAQSLAAFLTPGEDEPVWVGIHGLENLERLTLTVDTADAPVAVDVRHLHFWPQRTGWRSREWYITPELILPCAEGKRTVPVTRGLLEEREFNLAAGETAAFWLTLTAPSDAPPGRYRAMVSIRGADRPALLLPLEVEILPFRLQRPTDRHSLLYADTSRWRHMSDEQVMAELRDFARHGVTGLVEMPLGSVDLTGIREGKVSFDASAFNRLAAMCVEAGIPGPHVCHFGGIPGRVRDALGLTVDLQKDTWPRELQEGVEAVARAAVEATADAPARWYFYGVDEPSGDNTYAIQEYQCWRRGGAETYATFYRLDFLEKASEYLTAPCFVVGLVSTEARAQAAREACEETGAEFWWYGTGSYVNPFPQERYVWHNRYGAGFLFWKTGARAQVAWTFCRPHEDVFNDFDGTPHNAAEPKEQVTAYPHLLAPGDWSTYQGAIPTLAWEGLREGADDYAYLHTLSTLIEQAKAGPAAAARTAATEAEQVLEALVDAIPWANPMNAPTFPTDQLQQARRVMADLTVGLQEVMQGRAEALRPTDRRVTIRVRTEAPQGPPAALPAIPVMPANAAPVIDGLPGEPAWEVAAVADGFLYVNTGRAAQTPTEARIMQDDRFLYVAFDCPEPRMDGLVARQHGRDAELVWLDDGVELFVAGADRRRYAHVIVNTNASVYDEVNQDPSWDLGVQVGVDKRADGWSVELAIPWAELERAGIERAPVMAVNFCRSRFAGEEPHPHSAWSFTGAGFHVPERFGIALLQEGPVALAALGLPSWWGRQEVPARLRNLTAAPVEAEVGFRGQGTRTLTVPAAGTADVTLPVNLRRPGPRSLRLTWGRAGEPSRETRLYLTVPEPLSLRVAGGLVSAGRTLELPVAVNLAPTAPPHRLRLTARGAAGTRTVELPAAPGHTAHMTVRAAGILRLATTVVEPSGRLIEPGVERAFVVAP